MNEYGKIGDFHAARRAGIGSSDIPVLAGLTLRYGSTPLQLWQEKTGRAHPWTGNDATWWGHAHENTVLYRYVLDHYEQPLADRFLAAKLRGRSAGPLKVQTEFRHPEYRFALAHPDLLIEPEARIVEAKSHGLYAAERKDDPDYGYNPDDLTANGLPAAVFLQVQWQLFCAGIAGADVAVLINTSTFRCYGPVLAQPRVQESSLALAERFWWHVEHDKPPQPVTWDDVCSLFPVPRQTTAMVAGEQELLARKLVERKRRLAKLEAKIKAEQGDVRNALGLLIGENAVLATAEGELLARSYGKSRETVDIAALRKLPDLLASVEGAGLIKRAEWRELR